MHIALFGATGRTGSQLVAQALQRAHEVTAVVRDRARLATPPIDSLRVIEADVMDPVAVARLLEGHDAAVSVVGPRGRRRTTVCRDSAGSIVQAMDESGVRRLIVVSAAGFHTDGDGPLTKALVKPLLGRLLREGFADMQAMENEVMGSDTEWTVFRPPMLTNGRLTGAYRTSRNQNVRGGIRISRADLAHAILDGLDDPGTVRTAIGIAY